MVGLKSAGLLPFLAIVCLTGCGKSASQNPVDPNKVAPANPSPKTAAELLKPEPKAKPESPVKAFSFAAPAAEWAPAEPSTGDATITKAGYKSGKTQLKISSIGLPPKGKQATELVKECETGFANGYAKHPEQTREWITQGFSISRYADSAAGTVSVWCISPTCNVKLDFSYGAGSNSADNVKKADDATNAFFAKNPTGGAVLK